VLHDEEVLGEVQKEVRGAFGNAEEIVKGDQLTSCHFLRACIDEAMRMSPPVGGALPRQVLPGGITIDGHAVPEGIDVCVPHYAIHHNPVYYPNPFTYNPSRWLAASTSPAELEVAHSTFCAFSIGPRGCIGKGLAYVELMMTLARVLWSFDMRLAPGKEAVGAGKEGGESGRQRVEEYQLKDTFTSMKDGPIVQFRLKL